MFNKIIFFLVLFFATSSVALYGQATDSTATDIPSFLSELKDFVTSSQRPEVKKSFDVFVKSYEEGILNEEEVLKVKDLSERMREIKMLGYPHSHSFFQALESVTSGQNKERYFFKWLLIVETYLETTERGKFTPVISYFDFTNSLFSNRKLSEIRGGVSWGLDTLNVELDYDAKVKEPIVRVPQSTLYGIRKEDTIIIEKTSGIYSPVSNTWKGKGGFVSWERHDRPEINVKFMDYSFDMTKSEYRVDTVDFIYPEYFDSRLQKGSFKDGLITGNGRLKYPKFESFDRVAMEGVIAPNINYYGNFKLHGLNFLGVGRNNEEKAIMEFYNDSKGLDIRSRANTFSLKENKIYAKKSETSLYFDQDSLFHPYINIIYNTDDKKFEMTRDKAGPGASPFFDSYHKVDIKAKNLVYFSGKDSIQIGAPTRSSGKSSHLMKIESFEYFSEGDYRKLQNIDNVNPISILKQMYDENGTNELHAEDIAKRLNPKYAITTIQGTLFQMTEAGFIYYNPKTQMVTLKDKLFHYANAAPKKSSRARAKVLKGEYYDYDRLQMVSNSKDVNAVIDLKDKLLYAEGINGFVLSDSQLVVVRPFEDKIILKENRNIDYDGRTYGGYMLFFGTENSFLYDEFIVEMDSIQFVDIMIPTGDEDTEGNKILKPINASLEDLTGVLYIDRSDNKSSVFPRPEYPRFESLRNSYIYYDKKSIQSGAYDRDSFYFEATPFVMDSIDNLDPDQLAFDGTMNSAGIFPEFDEKLTIQEDMSLGFVRPAPPEGFKMYGSQSSFKNDISLNNGGLTGSGTMEHYSATIESDSIQFLPNQLKAEAHSVTAERSPDYGGVPNVNSSDVTVDWRPYQDSMIIRSNETPHVMFDGDHNLTGDLILQETGMKGNGTLDWPDAIMKSNQLEFKENGVRSDTTYLGLKALVGELDEKGEKKLVMRSENVKAEMDFSTRKAVFEANSKEDKTELPFVQYITSMNQGGWNLDDSQLKFRDKDAATARATARFISIHPNQDSLDFIGEFADYDLVNNTLIVSGVELIETADAYVYPPDGIVEIGIGANMQTFQDAKIICSTTNKNHEIVKANVDIKGKYNYVASGYYVYNVGDKEQEILLNDITVGRDRKLGEEKKDQVFTQASGKVTDFYIDEKIKFEGDVHLKASSKDLSFKGYAQLLNNEITKSDDYFFINAPIDKNDVSIVFENPVNKNKEKVYAGLRQSAGTNDIYALAMQKPKKRSDHQFFTAKGLLKYDPILNEFRFGDSSKVLNKTPIGNLMTLNNTTLDITTNGEHKFLKKLDFLDLKFFGEGKANYKEAGFEGKTMATLDFQLPKRLLEIINEDFFSLGFALKENKIDKDIAEIALPNILPSASDARNAMASIKSVGVFELPKKWKRDFILTDMNFKWDKEYGSMVLDERRIGITHIDETPINKKIKAFSEIRLGNPSQTELFTIYMEISDNVFYYFEINGKGELKIFSSNSIFMDVLTKMKKKDTELKIDGKTYTISPTEIQDADFFKRRMQAVGSGGGTLVQPGAGTAPVEGGDDDFFDFEDSSPAPVESTPPVVPNNEPVTPADDSDF